MKAWIAAAVLVAVLFPRRALAVVVLAVCAVPAYRLAVRAWEAHAWRHIHAEVLRQRCELQHGQVMAGDPAGWSGATTR